MQNIFPQKVNLSCKRNHRSILTMCACKTYGDSVENFSTWSWNITACIGHESIHPIIQISETALHPPTKRQGVQAERNCKDAIEKHFLHFILRLKALCSLNSTIVQHSSPRHSSPQTFITPYLKSDIHHLGHSSPQTFFTSDIHHPRHSSPQTFITSDIHHPLPKIRRSSPKTFLTPLLNSDIHNIRRSSPQTFITPYLKSDIHHLRHSSPPYRIQTFITSDVHHLRWWMSEVMNVWGDERLRWWMSGVMNVRDDECPGWWMSDFR